MTYPAGSVAARQPSAMNPPLIHIVTVLYNSNEAFTTLWLHLVAQRMGDWRLIAIDNASADTSMNTLRALADPRVTIIANDTNVGFARAVNQGLRAAAEQDAQRFLLLNPDTVPPPNFLQDLLDTWMEHEWPVVAPRVMRTDDPARSWYAGGHLDYGWTFANKHEEYRPEDPPTPRQVDFASGCCLGLALEALEQVGLLDESFFVYWEDVDLCMRLNAAGIPIHYLPDPTLLHEGGASSGGEYSPAVTRLYYASYAQLLRKHFGMVAAVRTMGRVLRAEHARAAGTPQLKRIAAAMLRGLRAPLSPEPRLPVTAYSYAARSTPPR